MTHRRCTPPRPAALLGLAAAFLLAPALYAHGGVTLCEHLNFGGRCETFERDVTDLRGSRVGNDEATSVRVDPGCRARLFQHPNFGGAYTELFRDTPDLRGSRVGDDSITSLEVRCDDHGEHTPTSDGSGYESDEGVTLYRDGRYTGVAETFPPGDVPDLRRTRVGDDHTTSVGLHRHCRARLYQHPDFRGDYTELRESIPTLRGSRVGDDGASSLKVRCGWDLDWDRHYGYR